MIFRIASRMEARRRGIISSNNPFKSNTRPPQIFFGVVPNRKSQSASSQKNKKSAFKVDFIDSQNTDKGTNVHKMYKFIYSLANWRL